MGEITGFSSLKAPQGNYTEVEFPRLPCSVYYKVYQATSDYNASAWGYRPMDLTHRNNGDFHHNVAIIGGGFAGAVTAAQLLRRAAGPISIALIERGDVPGCGVAYGTKFDGHLLNVPAQKMSAYPEDPDHFLRWAQANYHPSAKAGDFLPRRIYGQYVSSLLQEESRLRPGQFQCFKDEAVSVARARGGAEIRLRSGRTIVAEKVVLALGNFAPSDPHLPGKSPASSRYVSNPWSKPLANSLEPDSLESDRDVLLIGSGLTAIDVLIELFSRGFKGTVHMLSRRGLVPQTHKAVASWPLFRSEHSPRTARGLLRLLRTQVEAAQIQGSDWRAVIDSLRPVTQEIWRSLPQAEQERFLRHLRPYWDVHRHRVAPQIGAQVSAGLLSGQIQMHAGRITAYVEDSTGAMVSYRERKSGEIMQLRVDRTINCTGPEGDLRRVKSPLLLHLMEQNLVSPDALSLGLKVSEEGSLVDRNGTTSDVLYTVGSLRRGTLWETTAVPELRTQASELAALLLSELERKQPEFSAMELSGAAQISIEQAS